MAGITQLAEDHFTLLHRAGQLRIFPTCLSRSPGLGSHAGALADHRLDGIVSLEGPGDLICKRQQVLVLRPAQDNGIDELSCHLSIGAPAQFSQLQNGGYDRLVALSHQRFANSERLNLHHDGIIAQR